MTKAVIILSIWVIFLTIFNIIFTFRDSPKKPLYGGRGIRVSYSRNIFFKKKKR